MHDDLDRIYTEQLLKLIMDSSLDALVLLAQDIAHADDGTPLPDQSKFYVPNEISIFPIFSINTFSYRNKSPHVTVMRLKRHFLA